MHRRQFIGMFSFFCTLFVSKDSQTSERNPSQLGGMDLAGEWELCEQQRRVREAEEKNRPILDVYG